VRRRVDTLISAISIALVPETPEDLYERAKDALRTPPVEEWETWPFEGELRPKALLPPDAAEPPRHGEGGVECWACDTADSEFVWMNDRWRLSSTREPPGLPVVVVLFPRAHYADPGDLPDDVAAELGIMLSRVERAVRSVGEIGRVHVCRWGDGSEHLHWWFLARPARLPQLKTNLVAIWDDVLPPLPEDLWRENLAAVAKALG
jgi:diadenosine tetraphosphate (Ap4A) HIT family hydrolase